MSANHHHASSTSNIGEGEHLTASEGKAVPKDAVVLENMMLDLEVTDWEPRVITQLLEFLYKYILISYACRQHSLK